MVMVPEGAVFPYIERKKYDVGRRYADIDAGELALWQFQGEEEVPVFDRSLLGWSEIAGSHALRPSLAGMIVLTDIDMVEQLPSHLQQPFTSDT